MSDLLLFLAALDAVHAPLLPTEPTLDQLVEYSLGTLPRFQREEIETFAADNQALRLRLFDVWQSVQALAEGSLRLDAASPHQDPFLAELASIWHRKTSAASHIPRPRNEDIPIVGRDEDSARILKLLSDRTKRLTTLIGPGGVGKTCLLRKMESDAGPLFPDGVFTLECASFEQIEQLYSALASAIGIEAEEDIRREVVAFLENRRVLLLLDRMDDLPHLGAEIQMLLGRSVWLRVLATSRTPIGTEGETCYTVGPLATTDQGTRVADAVTLFTSMARRVLGDFKVTAARMKLIREVCRLAMGAPLALSIAAGCLTDQSLSNLVNDLRQPVALRAEYVNQPVQNSIAHAFRLVSASDRDVLQRLGIFAGPFGFEDARYVSLTSDTSLSQALVRLQRYGLVECRVEPSGISYRLHDSVHDYLGNLPSDLLLSQGRHADLFARKAEGIGKLMSEGRWSVGTEDLLRNIPDLRRAMRHCIEQDDHRRIRQFADGLARTYFEAGYLSDFQAISEAAASLDDASLKIRMLGLQGALASIQGDEPRCTTLWQERLKLAKGVGDFPACADSLTDLAWQAFELGDLATSTFYLEESEAIARDAGIWELVATAQVIRSRILLASGSPDEALLWAKNTVGTLPKCSDKAQLPFVYQSLIKVYSDLGDQSFAMDLSLRLLSLAAEGHRAIHVGRSLSRLATLFEGEGQILKALNCYTSAVAVLNEYGTKDRRRIERELEAFCERHEEVTPGALEQARSTPWQVFIDLLLHQAQGSPSESTQ